MDINYQKTKLRLHYRALRNQITENYAEKASNLLLQNFINSIELKNDDVIAGYVPIDGEINIIPIMNFLYKKKYKVAIPTHYKKNQPLIFTEWKNSNEVLIPNIIIVPIIAFDLRLHRLGFGWGCYDRTISYLKNTNCKFIGVAYQLQYHEKLPINNYDQQLNIIITEQGKFTSK